ncbi:WD40-repeat-containing domain protein [Melanogaster broomeanus]|nr:WD40-repeat-containing domain protein [Melanogaster broomeanus]
MHPVPRRVRSNPGNLAGNSERSTIVCLAYSPSGALIVGGTIDASLFVWDSSGRRILGPIKGHGMNGIVLHVSFVTESLVLSTSDDLTARLWDAQSGERLKSFRKHQDTSKRTVASVSKDGVVMLWDMDTLEVVSEFEIQLSSILPVVFSPDGTRLVIFGCGDYALRTWDIESGEITGDPYEGHDDIPGYVACSLDGKLIVSVTTDGIVGVWDIQGHKSVAMRQGRGPVGMSMDSRYLVHPGVVKQCHPIPQRSTANWRDGENSNLDFVATSRPHREGLAPEENTKAGGRFSQTWKKLSRGWSRTNRGRQPTSFQDKTPVQRSSIAAARDRNPVAIARGARKRKEQAKEQEKGQEQPQEQPREQPREQSGAEESESGSSQSDASSTTDSDSSTSSPAEEDEHHHDSESHGRWHACWVWIRFKTSCIRSFASGDGLGQTTIIGFKLFCYRLIYVAKGLPFVTWIDTNLMEE